MESQSVSQLQTVTVFSRLHVWQQPYHLQGLENRALAISAGSSVALQLVGGWLPSCRHV